MLTTSSSRNTVSTQRILTWFMSTLVVLLSGCGGEPAVEVPPTGYATLLAFDRLPLLTDWPTYQASSYDRSGGNSDAKNFIRVEENGEQVMLEVLQRYTILAQ